MSTEQRPARLVGGLAFFGPVLLIVTAPFAQGATKKAAVPDEAAQKEAVALIRDVYKDEQKQATTPEKKSELAKKLIEKAGVTKDDPANQFVLLRIARDLAAQAGDCETALEAVSQLAQGFAVDAVEMKVGVLVEVASVVTTKDEQQPIVEAAQTVIGQAIAQDNYGAADRLGKLALAAARKSRDQGLVKHAQASIKSVKEAAAAFEVVQEAMKTLKERPADPDANLAVGKFLCFIKGDWKQGSPLLLLGSDATLKTLAEKEGEARDGAAQVKVGDGWWKLAAQEEGVLQTNLRRRALFWYTKALPGLTGLVKDKVEKRVAEVEAGPQTTGAEGQAITGTKQENSPAKPGKDGWIVIFRSSDPSIWNSDVNRGQDDLSVGLSKVPEDTKFLRMRAAGQRTEAIISIRKDKLGSRYENGNYGWNGTNNKGWNANHLGIYHLPPSKLPRGEVSLFHPVFARQDDCSGYGFGHRVDIDDVQGYTWNLTPLRKAVFEISVKAKALTKAEHKSLLQ
jgi:hypothetical protein